MTKEEKIQEAYGEYWEKLKFCIDENGWFNQITKWQSLDNYFHKDTIEGKSYLQRPKSLQGIENNNGWIKIESEEDLPTTEIDCHIIYNNNLMTFSVWDNVLKGFYIGIVKQNPTHYQPIIKPQPPLY